MQDQPLPGIAQDAAVVGPETLTAETIDRILADFRNWLEEIVSSEQVAAAPAAEWEPVGLHALVSQFTALRHEVNLQTKAARAQQEQAARSLEAVERAVESLCETESAGDRAAEDAVADALRPLLKSLLDVTDMMTL